MCKSIYKNKELYELMKEYYKNYYLRDLKLYDWQQRFRNYRVNEEEILGSKVVSYIESENINLNRKNILVVGGGTGAEVFFIYNKYKNASVYTIEPFNSAIEILRLKAQLLKFPLENIKQSFSENLPFKSNLFDVVICFTVLEHVDDVEKSILEMYRVTKTQGVIMIETPNYLFPEEQHYKATIFPPRLSRTLAKLNLKLYGKYTDYFETLNIFSSKDIDNILNKYNLNYLRKDEKRLHYCGWKSFLRYFVKYTFSWIFGISRNQLIFINKE